MNTVDRVISTCKEKGISIAKLERDCGFSNGYIRGLRKGSMPNDRLSIVADYLGVSANYLSTGESSDEYYYNDETLQMAQTLYENPELHMLFSATKDATPSELKSFYDMVMIMKRKENHED